MFGFVVAHLVVALLLPLVARRSTRAAFFIAAIPPAAAAAWLLARTPQVLAGGTMTETVPWVPLIGLNFGFRLDALSLVMTILVCGLGVLVLIYADSYFARGRGDARRSAPLLLAFAGAMLGLVVADDLTTVYVFWELTTVCSFLLVGQAGISRESRRSALQALMITSLGGLVMLLGFVVLGESAGTYRISELVAHPPSGTAVSVAAVLILVGAFTKSAQLPFHNWLPAAMVAPTPISAYLHAASMVKAGVFLIARLGPIFESLPEWRYPAIAFGLATMLFGGWRALHEYDLKKLLAYGTVSQLGFLVVLFGESSHDAALAGAAMLLGHGLFKATLFLVVGMIDHQAGTRDIRKLSGLASSQPWLAVVAGLAAASMAGLPPMLGFLGKEAAFGAFLTGPAGVAVDVVLVIGSMLTVAYSLRMWFGAFATKPDLAPTTVKPAEMQALIPTALPAIGGVLLGLAYPLTHELADSYARSYDSPGKPAELALWHGLNFPLAMSLLAVAGGLLLHRVRTPLTAWRTRIPKPLNAQRGYERITALLERVAVAVTARTQVGSLPTYLGIILVTVVAVPGSALLVSFTVPDDLRAYDNLMQLPLALGVVVAALAVLRAHRRLTAVLLVGVIGYGIGGLFIVDGAPDLALAQFLVETLTVVAFAFVLRRLPERFSEADTAKSIRIPKAVIATVAGVFVSLAAIGFSSVRHAPPEASEYFIDHAEKGAGATNVVNSIIVDFRAFDTVGEIAVLAVAATGVASLILASRHERRRREQQEVRK
ncbi:proton-conducting transporter membrane subunit [Saccharopolyspora sp. TS4A08]|uniref:Proton-conducting transporter membrane subunit n=1 Tax=Saccharopolyspora ipomoeae TaxID=3042027 RepID=A0ABT6PW67_9PSEU|nr:hydrogen gas-evolving membrane-bound hydrogenase subunit E [Saccharopolyspora sp. TS4A08]MDI2032196.1 proton-conducting transporter membrane subunit [Saccharopolyspora sp. TS4A08]